MIITKKYFVLLSTALISLASHSAVADGLEGIQRIRGADCQVFKGSSPIGSITASIRDGQAKVYAYNGPRNSINPNVGLAAAGTGTAYSMVGFPVRTSETVVIILDENMKKVVGLPRLVLSAKIQNPSTDMPANGFLADPFSDVDDVDLRCYMNYDSTQEDLFKINPEHMQRAENPSLCAIEFRDVPRVNSWTLGCTASVIGENKLLTAAHCLESFARTETRVRCGQDTEFKQIETWKMNKKFRPVEHPVDAGFDTSVITLDSKVSAPALLVESNTEEVKRMIRTNSNCRHYGMGNRQDGTVGLLYMSPYQMPAAELGGASFVESRFAMGSGMIASDPNRFMRNGDSGGPIVCQNAQGHDTIVGVHSMISTASSSAISAMTSQSYDFIQSELSK